MCGEISFYRGMEDTEKGIRRNDEEGIRGRHGKELASASEQL